MRSFHRWAILGLAVLTYLFGGAGGAWAQDDTSGSGGGDVASTVDDGKGISTTGDAAVADPDKTLDGLTDNNGRTDGADGSSDASVADGSKNTAGQSSSWANSFFDWLSGRKSDDNAALDQVKDPGFWDVFGHTRAFNTPAQN